MYGVTINLICCVMWAFVAGICASNFRYSSKNYSKKNYMIALIVSTSFTILFMANTLIYVHDLLGGIV